MWRASAPAWCAVDSSDQPKGEYIAVRQLVAQFVVSNQDTTNFARVELWQPNAQSRVGRDTLCACRQLTDKLGGSGRIDGSQKVVKARKVRLRFAGPAERHDPSGGGVASPCR